MHEHGHPPQGDLRSRLYAEKLLDTHGDVRRFAGLVNDLWRSSIGQRQTLGRLFLQ